MWSPTSRVPSCKVTPENLPPRPRENILIISDTQMVILLLMVISVLVMVMAVLVGGEV